MQPPTKALRVESLRPLLLCIDDNALLLECCKEFLQAFGFEVLTASCGREGLELAALIPVDLVLLDYQMPEMDGGQVAVDLRRMQPGTPIILMSGVADIPAQMVELVDGFVRKGDMAGGLLPAIAGLIGMPKSLPEHPKAVAEKTAASLPAPAA